MQKRTKATSIKKKVRDEVLHRDHYNCVNCGTTQMLTIAHVFVSRAKGGLGVKENLATLCMECHHKYDNGMKREMTEVQTNVVEYMLSLYEMEVFDTLKYMKYK